MPSSSHRLSRALTSALLATASLVATAPVLAAVVTTQAQQLGGSQWQLNVTITNDGTPAAIEGLTLHFDRALFANLGDAIAPTGWDPLLFQPDTALDSDGAFDVLVLDPANALLPGQSLGGFSLRFDLLGSVLPDTWSYDLYRLDANSGAIDIVDSGRTVEAVARVPLPASLALALLGLGLMGPARRFIRVRTQGVA